MIITDDFQPSDEWQTDASGKRFRFDGRVIEYETQVTTSHGTLTQRQLAAMNAKEKEKSAPTPVKFPPVKHCPFKTGMNTACGKDKCAWYTGTGCAQSCPHPATGKKCPHRNTLCADDCALRTELRKEINNEQI